jgi:hypothetical protein
VHACVLYCALRARKMTVAVDRISRRFGKGEVERLRHVSVWPRSSSNARGRGVCGGLVALDGRYVSPPDGPRDVLPWAQASSSAHACTWTWPRVWITPSKQMAAHALASWWSTRAT